MSITAKNLTAKLLGKKIVHVTAKDKSTVEFEIHKVNIETFAGEGVAKLEVYAGKSPEEIGKVLQDQFKNKEVSKLIAPVLVKGVCNPKVVEKKQESCEEDEISIDTLLIDLELSTNLYMKILELSTKD